MCEIVEEFSEPSMSGGCRGCRGEEGLREWGWVVGALVKVLKVKPGDMCVKGGADVRHVLLCDHTREMVYEWGKEKRGDVFTGMWRVE